MSTFTQEQEAILNGGDTSGKTGGTFDRLLKQESGGRQFNTNGGVVTSSKGATGIAQVMPATGPEAAKLAGVEWNPERFKSDPEYNKSLGRAYFDKQLATFGNERLALAAYNAGPGAVQKAIQRAEKSGGDPLAYLPEETQKYVPAILGAGFGVKRAASSPWSQQPKYVDPGFNKAIEHEALQDAADESPVSTSLERGWEGLKHNAGLFLDNVADDSEGAAERIKAKREWDDANPAPRSSTKFVEQFQQLAEDDYAGMLATAVKNPGGALNQMVEQTPNSLPALALQIPVGIASSALYASGWGAPLAVGLQGLAAFVGNALPEGGAYIEEQLGKAGINPNDTTAVAKWIAENRGKNLEGGAKKAGVISLVDGATGYLGGKLIAGPSIRFAQAEAAVFAKAGVKTTDKAAVAAARATPAYKQAMAQPAQELLTATTRAQKTVRELGGLGLETAGEGLGEYAGSYAADGAASVKDAVLESMMGAGTSAAMTGANMTLGAMKGPDGSRADLEALAATPQPAQPTITPNSPLANAASIAQAAAPQPAAVDPFDGRLSAMQSFVEDKAFIQALRGAQGYGPESVTEALSAFAKARNPNLDPMVRERALSDLEGFVESFNGRPNFTFGNQQPDPQTPPGQQVAPFQQPGGAVGPAITPDDGRTLNGEVITRPDTMAGANPNQISAPPVLGLPTEEALQAKRDADAAYEQAYQDLVKSESLGASDQDLAAKQQAIREARAAREQADARMQEIERAIEGNRTQQTAEKRRAVLDAILADPATANPAARLSAELKRQGFRDTTPTQAELDTIQRFSDIQSAEAEPDIIPSSPNELDPYQVRQERPQQPAKPRITTEQIKQAIASGATLSKDVLTLPDGSRVKLKGPQIAAAREAIRKAHPEQVESVPAQPSESAAVTQEAAPQQVELQAPVSGNGGASDAVESVARIIHESIAENALKNIKKTLSQKVEKGWATRDQADESVERDRKTWANAPINDRTIRIAQSIIDKDARSLVGAWAKEGQGTYGNEGSMSAFEKITGVKLRRLNSAQRAKAIFDWAGWSEDQVAEDVSRRRSEMESRQKERQEKDDDATAEQAGRAQIKIRETGEVKTVREYIDGLIAEGYTEIRTTKRGAVTKTVLANSEGWGRYLSSGIVKDYAEVASRRSRAAAESTPADVSLANEGKTTQPAEPEAENVDPLDKEISDAAAHLADVLADVFGAKLNITGPQHTAADLLPAMQKVIGLLVQKGFKTFAQAVGQTARMLRDNGAGEHVEKITPRQWKAAYQFAADMPGVDGAESEEAVAALSADKVLAIVSGHVDKAKAEAEARTDTNPSDAQKEAENYRKGKFSWNGQTIAVENPKGSERTGKGEDGAEWRTVMPATYGYFLGTVGADKDHVDVFMGDTLDAPSFWVINQTQPDSAKFDEHKVVAGVTSADEAKRIYLDSFSDGFGDKVFSSIAGPYPVGELADVLPKLKANKPFGVKKESPRNAHIRAKEEAYAARREGQPVPPKALEIVRTEAGKEFDKAEATHKDPGQPAEAVTPAVVAESIRKSAANTPLDVKEAKAYLLAEIDKAILAAGDKSELEAELAREKAKKFDGKAMEKRGIGSKTIIAARDAFNALRDSNIAKTVEQIGFVTFDVPGDGKFKVANSAAKLQEFRRKVETSPGFKEPAKKPPIMRSETNTGSYGPRDAILEGDYLNAYELAKLQDKPLVFSAGPTGKPPAVYTDASTADGIIDDVAFIVARYATKDGKWFVIEPATGLILNTNGLPSKVAALTASKALTKGKEDALRKVIADPAKAMPQSTLEAEWLAWAEKEEGVTQEVPAEDATPKEPTPDEPTNAIVNIKASKDINAWLEENVADQFQLSDSSLSGSEGKDQGVGSLTLEKKMRISQGPTGGRTVDGSDVRNVFQLKDGRLVWWNNDTGDVLPVDPTDPRYTENERYKADIAQYRADNAGSEINPLDLTPNQYHAAKLKAVADEYNLTPAEVREDYDTDVQIGIHNQEWIDAVRDAFRDGSDIDAKVLDRLHELRPGALASFMHDNPDARIPNGYQTPDARKTEKAESDARKDARSDVGQPTDISGIFTGLSSRGLAKNRAQKAAEAHPRAAQIAYVQDNFMDILTELEDSGRVKINCD